MPTVVYRKERMPCGCKKGRWVPNTAAVTADAGPLKGPKAPGYAAPSKEAPKPTTSGARKKPATKK